MPHQLLCNYTGLTLFCADDGSVYQWWLHLAFDRLLTSRAMNKQYWLLSLKEEVEELNISHTAGRTNANAWSGTEQATD